jgi:poly(A) polymerase
MAEAIVLPQATNVEQLARLIELEEKFFCKTDAIRRLAALIGEGACFVSAALKLPNDDAGRLKVFTQRTESVSEVSIQALHRAVYALGNDAIRSLLLLGAAKGEFPNDRIAEFYHEATSWRAPRFPLTGEDVMKQGVAAGPEIGKALKTVEDWWTQNDFAPGRTECLERLNKL